MTHLSNSTHLMPEEAWSKVVRVVACEAKGPGFDSSSDQMVFLIGYKEVGKSGSLHDKIE